MRVAGVPMKAAGRDVELAVIRWPTLRETERAGTIARHGRTARVIRWNRPNNGDWDR